ncbi:DNA-binding CsgD family transcriptional regulator [Bradyrhizobium sp. USDA 3397]
MFEEAATFGIRYGFTFPIHDDNGGIAALSFATDEPRARFEHFMLEHVQSLRLIATFFHVQAKRFWVTDHMISGVLLSPREFECLEWSSRGKSISDIGIILGIPRRTAAFHLDNVRAKLGVRTICQAVARLAEANSRR